MLKFTRNSRDRLRLRGGAELRGRDRPLSPVHGRPHGQHLPQAQGEGRCRRGGHRSALQTEAPGSRTGSRRTSWPISGTSSSTAASLEEEVLRSVAALEFSHLAKFAFLLCQKFNGYYHKYPVLAEENPEVKAFRLTRAPDRQGPAPLRPGPDGHSPARANVTATPPAPSRFRNLRAEVNMIEVRASHQEIRGARRRQGPDLQGRVRPDLGPARAERGRQDDDDAHPDRLSAGHGRPGRRGRARRLRTSRRPSREPSATCPRSSLSTRT